MGSRVWEQLTQRRRGWKGLPAFRTNGSVALGGISERAVWRHQREMAWGLALLSLMGAWILYDKHVYFRHSVGCYSFSYFSIPQGSYFPVQASFQKPSVGRCKAGVCRQLSLGPHSTSPAGLASRVAPAGSVGVVGNHLLLPIVHHPLSGPRPLL